jgi:hypothetical protein
METVILRAEHQLLEGGKRSYCAFSIISFFFFYMGNLVSVRLLQVVPSVAIGFTVYDMMKSYLSVPSRDEAVIEVVSSTSSSEPTSLHS